MQQPGSFDWNDENEARHFDKHGITFDFATGVFIDPDRFEDQDFRQDYDPSRFNTVGMVDGICINVTFAMKGDTAIIISARSASRPERRRYGS